MVGASAVVRPRHVPVAIGRERRREFVPPSGAKRLADRTRARHHERHSWWRLVGGRWCNPLDQSADSANNQPEYREHSKDAQEGCATLSRHRRGPKMNRAEVRPAYVEQSRLFSRTANAGPRRLRRLWHRNPARPIPVELAVRRYLGRWRWTAHGVRSF